MSYRPFQKSPSPEIPITQLSLDDNPSDPELAKYLNRDYWESRKVTESPASPSAPSPMAQPHDAIPLKVSSECFFLNITQVESSLTTVNWLNVEHFRFFFLHIHMRSECIVLPI